MNPALRALLGGIVDYAGLFPPAQLPLEPAIRNYARYRTEPESWMFGRFIIPASKLTELTPLGRELFRGQTPFCFSVLGRSGRNDADFQAAVKQDLTDIEGFRETFGSNVLVEAYEVKLPTVKLADSALVNLIGTTAKLFKGDRERGAVAFFESPNTDRNSLDAVIGALARDHCSGFKLRTGGLEAGAFPAVDEVAHVLAACRSAGVPFKATAGLHHPVRHYNADVQTKMHGFLNVFGGGCLAYAHKLSEMELQEIIADEDSTHFSIDQDGLRWKDLRVAMADIVQARRESVTSFGSCSFDEPRDDLRGMKWL
ncbi:MAG: hypothetical protein HY040_26330 [Planctomycetes bacterium]|nr:hypothetical protein [Planctomycetota bacterium]